MEDQVTELCARIQELGRRARNAGIEDKLCGVLRGFIEDLESYEECLTDEAAPTLDELTHPWEIASGLDDSDESSRRYLSCQTSSAPRSDAVTANTITTALPCYACGKRPSGRVILACRECGEA